MIKYIFLRLNYIALKLIYILISKQRKLNQNEMNKITIPNITSTEIFSGSIVEVII